jgi:hypothetical protein
MRAGSRTGPPGASNSTLASAKEPHGSVSAVHQPDHQCTPTSTVRSTWWPRGHHRRKRGRRRARRLRLRTIHISSDREVSLRLEPKKAVQGFSLKCRVATIRLERRPAPPTDLNRAPFQLTLSMASHVVPSSNIADVAGGGGLNAGAGDAALVVGEADSPAAEVAEPTWCRRRSCW